MLCFEWDRLNVPKQAMQAMQAIDLQISSQELPVVSVIDCPGRLTVGMG
jgi:hypothetical protein